MKALRVVTLFLVVAGVFLSLGVSGQPESELLVYKVPKWSEEFKVTDSRISPAKLLEVYVVWHEEDGSLSYITLDAYCTLYSINLSEAAGRAISTIAHHRVYEGGMLFMDDDQLLLDREIAISVLK